MYIKHTHIYIYTRAVSIDWSVSKVPLLCRPAIVVLARITATLSHRYTNTSWIGTTRRSLPQPATAADQRWTESTRNNHNASGLPIVPPRLRVASDVLEPIIDSNIMRLRRRWCK